MFATSCSGPRRDSAEISGTEVYLGRNGLPIVVEQTRQPVQDSMYIRFYKRLLEFVPDDLPN